MLEIKNLSKIYYSGLFSKNTHTAVSDVSFSMKAGEVLGIVGESGSGKSTLAQCILRLIEPTFGDIIFNDINISTLKKAELNKLRSKMQMIFQDPDSALDPKKTIFQSLNEPMKLQGLNKTEIENKIFESLEKVDLLPEHLTRYPHQLSGGQNQRIVISRVLSMKPSLIVADEPTASLDVSVQAQIIHLLKKIQKQYNIAMIFISHDLELIKHICHKIAVMYKGCIVEIAHINDIFSNPLHPYTQYLLNETSHDHDFENSDLYTDPLCSCYDLCSNHSSICKTDTPTLKLINSDHWVACNKYNIMNQ